MNYEIDCVHFDYCSGCVLNSCKNPPPIFDEASAYFAKNWNVDLSFSQGNIIGWRVRAKLAARRPNVIGLFEKGTHNVVSIPQCRVHHPKINEAVERLLQHNFSFYDEKSHTGDLRYVQCVVERKSEKVQLTVVLNMSTATPAWREIINKLYDPTLFHSIWCNYNDKPTNSIFSKNWEKISGLDVVWEEICGLKIPFGPSHFGQANLEMYEKLVLDIRDNILQNSVVAELYAGIGVIGLACAKKSKEVRLAELEPAAKHFFDLAVEPLPEKNRLSYLVGKAEECLHLIEGADVCIVDPPRKGLGRVSMERILSTKGLKQLVYVSCEYKSLQRDLDYLLRYFPNWRVAKAKSYLFFPGTNQIETTVFLKCFKITSFPV